jgi:CheY-like chemotaxis protein
MPSPASMLIVDDSRIFRSALEASPAGQDGIEVVGSVFSGQKALEFVQATPPDVVTLDVEMPGMNGLQTLRAMQRLNAPRSPDAAVGVIMVSPHNKRGAEVTIQALRAEHRRKSPAAPAAIADQDSPVPAQPQAGSGSATHDRSDRHAAVPAGFANSPAAMAPGGSPPGCARVGYRCFDRGTESPEGPAAGASPAHSGNRPSLVGSPCVSQARLKRASLPPTYCWPSCPNSNSR